MLDAKIINWMMQGSPNVNDIYRQIEYDLLKQVFLPIYKPSLQKVHEYYTRHKSPPSYDILTSLLQEDEEDSEIVDFVKDEDCDGNEVGYFVDKIKDRYNKFLITKLSEQADQVGTKRENLVDFNDEMKRILSRTERLYKSDVFSEGNITDTTRERLDDYKYTRENPDKIRGFLSGYKELDDYTWGIKNSEMLVIGGASSSGKSLLMLNMAINAWLGSNVPSEGVTNHKDGKDILFISLEMSKKQLEHRADANVAKVRHRGLARGQLDPKEEASWSSCLRFQHKYDKKFYILDMPRGSSMGEIEAKYESLLGVFKPDAVFIDYLQLMKPTVGQVGQDWLDVG